MNVFGKVSALCALLLIACNESGSRQMDYMAAKLTIADQERQTPLQFVTHKGTYRMNLLGEWVLEGSLVSTATEVRYKDVTLSISYYSKTETLLGTERKTIYEFLAPGQTLPYKIKSWGYKGTNSIRIHVDSVTPA